MLIYPAQGFEAALYARFFEAEKWSIFIKDKNEESYAGQTGKELCQLLLDIAPLTNLSSRSFKASACKTELKTCLHCLDNDNRCLFGIRWWWYSDGKRTIYVDTHPHTCFLRLRCCTTFCPSGAVIASAFPPAAPPPPAGGPPVPPSPGGGEFPPVTIS